MADAAAKSTFMASGCRIFVKRCRASLRATLRQAKEEEVANKEDPEVARPCASSCQGDVSVLSCRASSRRRAVAHHGERALHTPEPQSSDQARVVQEAARACGGRELRSSSCIPAGGQAESVGGHCNRTGS